MILQQLGLWNIPQKSSKILAQNGGSCEMFKPPEKSSTQQNASSNRDRREPVPGKNPHGQKTHLNNLSSSWQQQSRSFTVHLLKGGELKQNARQCLLQTLLAQHNSLKPGSELKEEVP